MCALLEIDASTINTIPLFFASSYGSSDLAQITNDHAECTPLFIACKYGRSEIVRELLKQNDIDVNTTNERGETPLFISCHCGHSEIFDQLLLRNDLDVNKRNNQNQSPLDVLHNGRRNIILIAQGCTQNTLNKMKEKLMHHPGIRMNTDSDSIQQVRSWLSIFNTRELDMTLRFERHVPEDVPPELTMSMINKKHVCSVPTRPDTMGFYECQIAWCFEQGKIYQAIELVRKLATRRRENADFVYRQIMKNCDLASIFHNVTVNDDLQELWQKRFDSEQTSMPNHEDEFFDMISELTQGFIDRGIPEQLPEYARSTHMTQTTYEDEMQCIHELEARLDNMR